jgi:hypothetical protein
VPLRARIGEAMWRGGRRTEMEEKTVKEAHANRARLAKQAYNYASSRESVGF